MKSASNSQGLYIILISIHGLVRSRDLELGRDADTGGQITYIIELARALADHPKVGRVDLLTRQIFDAKVDPIYASPAEPIVPGAQIIRLPCGPRRYLRKEVLWPHLNAFADNALQHIRRVGRIPDVIHSHYADAGYAGAHLASLLGVPLVHTGHSLGRVKRRRLLDKGMKEAAVESQYNMSQRIEAEEIALSTADLVIASTLQEVEEQYSLYDDHRPDRMTVIPPGVDLSRFRPPPRWLPDPPIASEIMKFLRHPRKPIVLSISRPDERKNIAALVTAFAGNPRLRDLANLVVVAGNRDDISAMDKGPREVLTSLLMLMDREDLHGVMALPKHHRPQDVPDLYRLAARSKGVFVNPALTEPFGLTLIEAAACGLPIIATEDGGPRDIIANCKNGLLIDPLDSERLGSVLQDALADPGRWHRWSKNGLRGAHRHYSWTGHAQTYVRALSRLIDAKGRRRTMLPSRSRLPMVDRMLVCDIDNTLVGDREALERLLGLLEQAGGHVGFAIATGRSIESALDVLKKEKIPTPDVLITSVGSEIYYGNAMVQDTAWSQHLDHRWNPKDLRKTLGELGYLRMQPWEAQRAHKISYHVDPEQPVRVREIMQYLRKRGLQANVIYSHKAYLDILPIRATKGLALRHLGVKWGILPERFLVAGDSGNDEEMLLGNTLAVVVGNYSDELEPLRGKPRIHFAEGQYAQGIIDGIEFYDFLGDIRIPDEEGVSP